MTGANGMVGSHVLGMLSTRASHETLGLTREICDLEDQIAVRKYIRDKKPDALVHCAARVGGIGANEFFQFEALMKNARIDTNVIQACVDEGVETFLYLGSSCMYPPGMSRPLLESDIGGGKLEPTNEGYALAKLAGAKLCESASHEFSLDYKTIVPSNLYGPGDNFHPSRSHLLAAAIRKVHEAKTLGLGFVNVWGSGRPRREFTFVEDLANWIVSVLPMASSLPNYINVGSGIDHTVIEIFRTVMEVIEFDGDLVLDDTKPDGAPSKLMNSSLASTRFDWKPSTTLEAGIAMTYQWYLRYVGKNG